MARHLRSYVGVAETEADMIAPRDTSAPLCPAVWRPFAQRFGSRFWRGLVVHFCMKEALVPLCVQKVSPQLPSTSSPRASLRADSLRPDSLRPEFAELVRVVARMLASPPIAGPTSAVNAARLLVSALSAMSPMTPTSPTSAIAPSR